MKHLRPMVVGLLGIFVAAAAQASETVHEVEGIPVKPLIFSTINLGILLFVLGYFLRKPAKEFFASRAALIRNSLEASRRTKEEAQRKFSEYDERLKNIEAETQRLISELQKDGELERARIIKATQDQIQALGETTERVMAQELKRAKEDLKREAVNLAAELAERLVMENLKPEDQKRIVETYLNQMEKLS